MTIEIKELIIKANVGKPSNDEHKSESENQSLDQQKIIRTCVEQVMEILKREKER